MSEVNCKNSAKYWFRNDALYKAATTTSTTTTTIAPPITLPPPERPLRRPGAGRRPLRRRRPQVDYYYDDEEYDDDYVEERTINRRRKPIAAKPGRSRTRRPEFDEYGGQSRGYAATDVDDGYNKRPYGRERERVRDIVDDYEDERRPYEQPIRNRNRPTENRRYNDEDRNDRRNGSERRRAPAVDDDRRGYSASDRRPIHDDRRPNERRRYNRDRRPAYEEQRPVVKKPTEPPPSPPPRYDDDFEDDYDVEEELPPSRRNPDPEDDSAKIKPSGPASLYSRPRAPPKISRPVPISEKQKYQYTPKKVVTPPPEDEYEDYDYEVAPAPPATEKQEKRPAASNQRERRPFFSKDPVAAPIATTTTSTTTQRIETSNEEVIDSGIRNNYNKYSPRPASNRRPESREQLNGRNKVAVLTEKPILDDSRDSVEDLPTGPSGPNSSQQSKPIEYSVHIRDKYRNSFKKETTTVPPRTRPPPTQQEPVEYNQQYVEDDASNPTGYDSTDDNKDSIYLPFKTKFHRLSTSRDNIRNSAIQHDDNVSKLNASDELKETDDQSDHRSNQQYHEIPSRENSNSDELKEQRPVVRVVKRPFLPSRGGNPYLPRGLKPVGGGNSDDDESATDNTSIEMGSTISGMRVLEHSPPLVREKQESYYQQSPIAAEQKPVTQEPQIESPKLTLEKIYNSEYDVTLNDALNPTLKPLVSRSSPIGFSLVNRFDNIQVPYLPSDISYAPSQITSTSIQAPRQQQHQPDSKSSARSDYYDYEY